MTSRCLCQLDAHDFACPVHGEKCLACSGSGFTSDADEIEHNCCACDSSGRALKKNETRDPMEVAIAETHSQPHRVVPSEADICRLEKVAWDAHVEQVVIWYRDQIAQLRERVRETERALKLEADRRQAAWNRAAYVVEYYTGRDLDLMDEEYEKEKSKP